MRRGKPLGRSRRARLRAPERSYLVAKILQARPKCERCLDAPSTDCHELLSRARGGSILDRNNIVAVCRECHIWITTHPLQAGAEGFAVSQFDPPTS